MWNVLKTLSNNITKTSYNKQKHTRSSGCQMSPQHNKLLTKCHAYFLPLTLQNQKFKEPKITSFLQKYII
jgi:hypothetical protein